MAFDTLGKKRAIIQFKCGKRARTAKCPEVRVNIGKNSKYCEMFFRKQGDNGTVAH